MKKLQIIIIAFLISLSICAFASMQAKAQVAPWTFTLSYTVSGGGSPTAPTFNYYQDGVPTQTPLAAGQNFFTVDDSTRWSLTPNPLGGSTGTEQWVSNDALSGTATADFSYSFTYYHQYLVPASYSISDGSTPSASVVLSGASLGLPSYTTLSTSTQQVWLNAGSSWSVNSQIVAGSGTEQWIATSGASGIVGSSTVVSPLYYHQYKVSFAVTGSGSTSPTGSDVWENAGSLSITATPNTGYSFSSWSSNAGSITFNSANSASTRSTIGGTGTITATYTPNQYTLTVITVGKGTVTPSNANATYPNGTVVNLTATSATGWTFGGWSNDATGNTTKVTMYQDQTVTANFIQNTQTPSPSPVPTPTAAPTSTPTTTPNPSATPASTPDPKAKSPSTTFSLASMGEYLSVIAAAIVLAAVIVGLVMHRRKPANIIILS